MKQSETNLSVDYGMDKIQVLDLDEVEILKAMSVVPGMGHLALFRPERRMEVLERCGLSPRVSELRRLWAGDWDVAWQWFDPASMVHSSVYVVEDPGQDFLAFNMSVYATGLNARLVWKVLVDESPEWSGYTTMRVGVPEVAGFPEKPRLYERSDIEQLDSHLVLGCEKVEEVMGRDPTVDVKEACTATLGRLGLGSLVDGCGWPCDLRMSRLEEVPGYCYTRLFDTRVAGTVAMALGPDPTAGQVLELYVCACVFGFAAREGVGVNTVDKTHHLFSNGQDWRKNFVLLTSILAEDVQKVVGRGVRTGLTEDEAAVVSGMDDGLVLLNNAPCVSDCSSVVPDVRSLAPDKLFTWRVTRSEVFLFEKGCVLEINGLRIDCAVTSLLFRTNLPFEFRVVEGVCSYRVLPVTKPLSIAWEWRFGGPASSDVRHVLNRSDMWVLRAHVGPALTSVSIAEASGVVHLHDDLEFDRPLNEFRLAHVQGFSGFPLWPRPFVVEKLSLARRDEMGDTRVWFGEFSMCARHVNETSLGFFGGGFSMGINSSSLFSITVSAVHDDYSYDEGGLSDVDDWIDYADALAIY